MSKKHPRVWWSNNPPKVDWIRIIWKCQKKYHFPSLADSFAHEQCLMFGIDQIKALNERRASGSKGHKNPHKDIHVKYAEIPPDLACDDPLYDGNPVF